MRFARPLLDEEFGQRDRRLEAFELRALGAQLGGTFVERNNKAAECLRRNIAAVSRSLKQAGDEVAAVEADALSLPVGIGALPDLIFVDPPYDAIAEVATPLFAKWSELLPADWGGVIVFEMPGEQELAAPGWACRKRLGRGVRQPSVALFVRA